MSLGDIYITMDELTQTYLDYLIIEKGLSRNTIMSYSEDLARFLNFLEKNKKVLIPIPSFPRYEFHAKIMGVKPVFVNIYKKTELEKLESFLKYE